MYVQGQPQEGDTANNWEVWGSGGHTPGEVPVPVEDEEDDCEDKYGLEVYTPKNGSTGQHHGN